MKRENKYKKIGEYKYFNTCRFCGSKNVQMVIDLGLMPLAGGFIKNFKQKNQEKFYPLQLNFCHDCFLLQVNSSVTPDILFKDYFYFSSSIKTLADHFKKIAYELKSKIYPEKGFVVEIGCNDGSFINALLDNGFKALGIDPARNVVRGAIKNKVPIINSYFTEKKAKDIVRKYGRANAIFGFHSMAHIENMHDVIRGVKHLLKKGGFLAMEVHYLKNLIEETQFDMIYHEHQFYYSYLSLTNFFKQYRMEIFDIRQYEVRAGSIMFYVQNTKGGRKISDSVKKLIVEELDLGLNKIKTYIKFSKKITLRKRQLLNLLSKLKNKNKKIVGYGASGRGTIIANYCGLQNYLEYVVDDAKSKHGAFLPGTHHEIFPSSKIIKDKADYAVLFAWPFLKEVRSKNQDFKGKFIVPLPKVKII